VNDQEDRQDGPSVGRGAVSLDGYIAGPNESGFEHLFAWFAGGHAELRSVDPDVQFHLTEPDYRYLRDVVEGVSGRVDLTKSSAICFA
jgi:hypothetical protein